MPKTKVQKQLYALQDKKYQAFSLHLLPPDTPLIGVRLPILRRLSKSLTLEYVAGNGYWKNPRFFSFSRSLY